MRNKKRKFIKLRTNKLVKLKRKLIIEEQVYTLRRLTISLVNSMGSFVHARRNIPEYDPKAFYKRMVEDADESFKKLGFGKIEDKLVWEL